MSSQERTLKPAPQAKGLNFAVNQYPAHLTLAPEVYNHLRGLQKKAKELRTEVRTLRRLAQTQAMAVQRTLKPAPQAKGLNFAVNQYPAHLTLAPEVYNHLRGLQKKAKELRTEVRTLRRLAQTQAMAVREDITNSFIRIRATLLAGSGNLWGQGDQERKRLTKEEELYKQEVIRLETDLGNLESSVEGLRTEVINRRSRVNMSSVEDMALVLSRASKTVAELKMKFPELQAELRAYLSNEMENVCREEKFLKDEPDRLESALRRCKKLTGTLVTLKRLASVQEQRLPNSEPQPGDEIPRDNDVPQTNKVLQSIHKIHFLSQKITFELSFLFCNSINLIDFQKF
uniref:CSON005217 protein n=1 Tax=Culicoides sonorensis TaxID=179676 RepID=A0A336N2L1_CULSO